MQLGGEAQVHAEAAEQQPRVHEVRLALELVAPQVGQQAALRLQEDARLGEGDPGATPEAEGPAAEVRVVVDRVEALALAVGRIVVARGEEARELEAHPVLVEAQLHRPELRRDVELLALEGVVGVLAEGPVEGVRRVDAAEVAVAGQTRVVSLHLVGADAADLGRPHQEAVRVVVERALVLRVVVAQGQGMAQGEGVLPEDVGHRDLLLALLEGQ